MLEEFKRDRVAQLMLVGVVIFGFIVCGGLTAMFAFRFLSPSPVATSASAPAIAPTNPEPVQSVASSASPATMSEATRKTYTAFLFLQGNQVLLEETARQVAAGEVEGVKAFAQLLVVAAFLKGTGDALQNPPPDPNFQPAWEKAKVAVPLLQQVVKRWLDKEISAADVPDAMTQARTVVDGVLAEADQIMVEKYGADSERLDQLRAEAMNELRQSLAQSDQGGLEATQVPLDIAILSYSDYTDSINSRYIVGEIQNNSSQPVHSVNVIATFYNDAGAVVGTKTTYTDLDVVMPGQKAPFKILSDANPQATRYEIQIQARPGTAPKTNLQIIGANDRIGEYKRWYIAGEVINSSDKPAQFVKVVVTVYNDQGQVVEVSSTYSSLDEIPPRGKSPFEISFGGRDDFERYELQVQGQ